MSEFSMDEMVPLITEVIGDGGEFRLYPKGVSMRPLLRHGVDSVVLVAPNEVPRRGDILLYRRANGQYVLHRFMRFDKDGKLCFSGDNHTEIEHGIAKEQVMASVAAVFRKDKRRNTNGLFLRCYGTLMTVGIFKRPFLWARVLVAKSRGRA